MTDCYKCVLEFLYDSERIIKDPRRKAATQLIFKKKGRGDEGSAEGIMIFNG